MKWSEYATEMYRERLAIQDAAVEAYANGYATETADYYREIEPRVTFRDTLIQLRGSRRQH